MEIEAQKILEVVEAVLKDKDVQPGFPDDNGNTNTTWCNRGANRIATNLGYDMSIFLHDRGINWTTANMMYENAVAKAKEIYAAEAQVMANAGDLILAASFNNNGPGHVAIVCPCIEDYNNEIGPLIAETGWKCRVTHSKYAFNIYKFEPRYFIIPKKEVNNG